MVVQALASSPWGVFTIATTIPVALIMGFGLRSGRVSFAHGGNDFFAQIRRTYDSEPGGDSYLSFFERLTSVDLLHIDDLGAEKRSDWVLEQLYALVNERYETQRSILITTNLKETELLEQIGERTVSRLLEVCDEPHGLYGKDHRSESSARLTNGRQGPPAGAGLSSLPRQT